LSTVFKKKSEIGKCLKLFFGLLFLKSDEVKNCFYEDLMAIKPNGQRINSFLKYFEKNYISLESKIWA